MLEEVLAGWTPPYPPNHPAACSPRGFLTHADDMHFRSTVLGTTGKLDNMASALGTFTMQLERQRTQEAIHEKVTSNTSTSVQKSQV